MKSWTLWSKWPHHTLSDGAIVWLLGKGVLPHYGLGSQSVTCYSSFIPDQCGDAVPCFPLHPQVARREGGLHMFMLVQEKVEQHPPSHPWKQLKYQILSWSTVGLTVVAPFQGVCEGNFFFSISFCSQYKNSHYRSLNYNLWAGLSNICMCNCMIPLYPPNFPVPLLWVSKSGMLY